MTSASSHPRRSSRPREEVPTGDEGAVTVKNPCLSGGAIEVFLEPSPPSPRVPRRRRTRRPSAAAERIGPELGLEMVRTDGRDPEPSEGDLALVVAAHGRDELHALRRALEVGLPYVGLVASPRRGAAVIDELRAAGVDEDQLQRIDVPPGSRSALTAPARSRSPSSPGSSRFAGQRSGPAGNGRAGAGRGGSDLRDDGRGGGEHALGGARRRNVLLLRRGLQERLRGPR